MFNLRRSIAHLATASALAWMAIGAPTILAHDKPAAPPAADAAAPAAPDAPKDAPPPPAAEAPKEAAAPAEAPAAEAAPATPPQQPDSTATGANGGTGIDLQWPAIPAKSDPKTGLIGGGADPRRPADH